MFSQTNFFPKKIFQKKFFYEISDIGKEDLKRRMNLGPWKGEKENFHLFIFLGGQEGGKTPFLEVLHTFLGNNSLDFDEILQLAVFNDT